MGSLSPAVVIVLGNEKGGVGKSTIAVNLAVGLARSGLQVASVDLDGRQRTLSRWLEARAATSEKRGVAFAMPARAMVMPSIHDSASLNEERDFAALAGALERHDRTSDVIVIDTAAGDNYLAKLAHSLADIVITPVQDSPVDIDALLRGGENDGAGPASPYLAMIADARAARTRAGDMNLDWIVARSRRAVGPVAVRSAADLDKAAAEQGFRLVDGPCERAIYRDAFADGLTAFDIPPAGTQPRSVGAASARVAACAELEVLIAALYLPFPVVPAGRDMGAGGLGVG